MFCLDFSLPPQQLTELAKLKLATNLPPWENDIWQFISNWYNPTVTSITIYTSGSTGKPKPISHTKVAMLNSAEATCKALQLTKGNQALLCLPASKIGGMMVLLRSIHAGLVLWCIKPSASPFNDIPANAHFDFAAFTPMQLHSITESNTHAQIAGNIRNIILGGESVTPELLQAIKTLPNNVYHTFGMTETISHIALKRLNGANSQACYHTLPGITISTNTDNRLIIHAPALQQPNLLTNDIVTAISPTKFNWIGRADNVINSGGVKIQAEKIEEQLQNYIKVPFFIGALPHKKTGQQVVLALEIDTLNEMQKAELFKGISLFTGPEKIRKVLMFPQFMRTPTGKTKRKETLLIQASETITL